MPTSPTTATSPPRPTALSSRHCTSSAHSLSRPTIDGQTTWVTLLLLRFVAGTGELDPQIADGLLLLTT